MTKHKARNTQQVNQKVMCESHDNGYSDQLETCGVCKQQYLKKASSYCSCYEADICTLCCTMNSNCHNRFKSATNFFYKKISIKTANRVANFLLLWAQMLAVVAVTLWIVFSIQSTDLSADILTSISASFFQVFWILAVFTGIAAWWIELINESRDLAEIELKEQNQSLASEVDIRRKADKQANELVKAAGSNPIKKKIAEQGAKTIRAEAEKNAKKVEDQGKKQSDAIMAKARAEADKLSL